jgi:hypothetical protein
MHAVGDGLGVGLDDVFGYEFDGGLGKGGEGAETGDARVAGAFPVQDFEGVNG